MEPTRPPFGGKTMATIGTILEAIGRIQAAQYGSVLKKAETVALPARGISQTTVQVAEHAGSAGTFTYCSNFQCST